MRSALFVACLLALLPSRSFAEDAKPAAPPKDEKPAEPAGMSSPAPAPAAPAKPPAQPSTPEQQKANAVLAAVKAKGDAALEALAANDEIDPWLVADELIRRGELDAATAFAKAVPHPDLDALPGHIEARRKRGPDDADRELLAAVNRSLDSGNLQKVLERTDALAPEVDTPVRVLLRHARCSALAGLGRGRDCALECRSAGDAAVAMGWIRRGALLYDNAAQLALDANENALALSILQASLPLNERRRDRLYAARSLVLTGFAHEKLGDATKAVGAYDEALARFEALENPAGKVWVLLSTARLYEGIGDHAKEIGVRERAQLLLEAHGDRPRAADNLLAMGKSLFQAGAYARALEKLLVALARVKELGARPAEISCLIDIGSAYRGLGDRANAMTHFERARAVAEEIGDRRMLGNALLGVALAHLDSGEHAKALATYQQLLAEQEGRGDKHGAVATLAEMAYAYSVRGDLSKSLSTYQQVLARYEALGDKRHAASTVQSLGGVYLALGDLARGLTAAEDAVTRWRAVGDKAGEAGALVGLGDAYVHLGDAASARPHFQRGLALAEEIGNREWIRIALHDIAVLELDSGDPALALAAFEKVLELSKDLQRGILDAKTLRNIGTAHGKLKSWEKALEFHQQALKASEEAGDQWMVSLTCADVARDCAQLKDPERALQLFERSERVARSRRFAGLLVGALANRAGFHLERKESGPALRDAQAALQEAENLLGGLGEELGVTAREQQTPLFVIGTLAAVRERNAAAALTFLESGRAGALLDDLDKREALRWKAESLSPELQRLDAQARAKERAARETYEQVSRGNDLKALREANRALDEASSGVRQVGGRIQRELKQQAEFFYPRARPIEEIRAALKADQALILYGLCDEEAVALVLRADGERIVELGKAADVVAACEALDVQDAAVDPEPALEVLRKKLAVPLGLEENVKQVLVSPEGPLSYLPFPLLFSQTVAMTPSGATHVLLLDEQAARGNGILAIGDPDYLGVSAGAQAIYLRGLPLTALPATRLEATTIGTKTLLGGEASETKLFELLSTSPRWRAVHFACHGLVNIDKPMLSSLALTRAGDGDGFFTALEVLRTKIPADLVVLSACETAKGKIVSGEGIVGLTRAFMFAGSPRIICSLWKVDDEATRALMVEFYRLWNPKDGKPGLSAAEALRQAQAFVKLQEKWKHPYYWAAWVLWGLPS